MEIIKDIFSLFFYIFYSTSNVYVQFHLKFYTLITILSFSYQYLDTSLQTTT